VTGNYGNLRARTARARLTDRARFDIAQHLRRVVSPRKEHCRRRRMDSQNVASATDRSREPRRALAATCGRAAVRPAPRGGVCRNDRDHRPGRLRPIGSGYYL